MQKVQEKCGYVMRGYVNKFVTTTLFVPGASLKFQTERPGSRFIVFALRVVFFDVPGGYQGGGLH